MSIKTNVSTYKYKQYLSLSSNMATTMQRQYGGNCQPDSHFESETSNIIKLNIKIILFSKYISTCLLLYKN